MTTEIEQSPAEGIAIVGMAGRFPGARNLEAFWRNLEAGVESISHFSQEELEASRLELPGVRSLPDYVAARGILEGADLFDADFFGVTPREAAVMDPQQRVFLETAWAALEDAGYEPAAYAGAIGVWAGMSNSTYYLENVLPRRDLVERIGPFQAMLANEKDYLATRVSYKLNLRGPSINVYTACSTSLVAVCQAWQSLLSYQCDMALAGGVCICFPQRQGYLYQEGGISSPDGRCRPFDAAAAGTVGGEGVGVVVLKRLAEALEHGDTIYAVIKGAALNNDGSGKVSFTAPSVEGQAEVIALAQAFAGVDPGTISYVEAHGTATPLGDPIEVAALTQAFRAGTAARGFCAIGSVKSNIGHLDTAAGVAGLIKTVLALQHRRLPPSLHFTSPNPEIDFASSPFYVNAELREWAGGEAPRRAGVSAFGIGGTNAHVVLEEAPEAVVTSPVRPEQLLMLSAKTEEALSAATANLARHLRAHPGLEIADVAHTLRVGRRTFGVRRTLVARDAAEAATILESADPARLAGGICRRSGPPIVFMFPGQGVQQVGMAAGLYRREAAFRAELDGCAEALLPHLDFDVREVILAGPPDRSAAEQRLTEAAVAASAIFAVEYALARLWMAWGVTPASVVGHSLGEYAAACLAGVMSRDAGASLVVTRSRLQQAQPRGAMLAVWMPASELASRLGPALTIAGFNAPGQAVVSGDADAVRVLEKNLLELGVNCRVLQTSHAFHSPSMDGALAPFREAVGKVKLAPPALPWVSTLTGEWMAAELATDPEYWVRQLREPVRFSDGVRKLAEQPDLVFLEVGPGHTLSSLVRQHRGRPEGQVVVTSLGADPALDAQAILEAAGRIWIAGVEPDWEALNGDERRRRVPLPTYPFERKRHWVAPAPIDSRSAEAASPAPVPQDAGSAGGDAVSGAVRPAPEGTGVERRLRAILSSSSGIGESAIDASRTFLDLGFDSLLLTQVSSVIERSFGIRVTFRKLLEELPTLQTLTAHIESRLVPAGPAEGSRTSSGDVALASAGLESEKPPVPGARLGRDASGSPAWFVPDPARPGKYLQVTTDAEPAVR